MSDGEITEENGRTRVRLHWEAVGPDLVLRFSGAGEHVGAVALGDFDPWSGRAYVQCLSAPGHRDDLIARQMALDASRRLRRRVVALGGVHLEDITSAERAQIVANAERLLARFLEAYTSTIRQAEPSSTNGVQESHIRSRGEQMKTVDLLRANLADAHWLLEQTVADLSPEHILWPPPGTANTIAATYAHVIGSEDAFVQGKLRGVPPLAQGEWAGRDGITLPIPERESDWFSWSRAVRVDLPTARPYAAAVYAATDAYLATLTPEQLDSPPPTPIPGNQTLSWLIYNLLTMHANLHTGEIAVVKGLQGLRGYP